MPYRRHSALRGGRVLEAHLNMERKRSPRADLQSAPGRLRASVTPALRPVWEVQSLDWDRRRRVTPASLTNCVWFRKTGSTFRVARFATSQEAWPGVEPVGLRTAGESRGGAPEGERSPLGPRPHPMVRAPVRVFRRSASLRCLEARFVPLEQKLGCNCIAGTRSLDPPQQGEGRTPGRCAGWGSDEASARRRLAPTRCTFVQRPPPCRGR